MLILYVAIAWGIGLSFFFVPFSGKIFLLLLCIALCGYVYRAYAKLAGFVFLTFTIAILWAYVDEVRHRSPIQNIIHIMEDERVSVDLWGKIDSFPVVDGDRLRFFLKVEEVNDNGTTWKVKERVWVSIRLMSQHEQQQAKLLSRGDRITLRADLSFPNPPTNPGAFNFPRYLWQEYCYLQAYGNGITTITQIQKAHMLGWKGVETLRSFLEDRIEVAFSPEIAGLMKAMLIGVEEDIPAEIEDVYRDSGIVHIVAISGSHVMFIIAALIALLQLFRVTRECIYEFLLIFLPLYMFLTGLSPSVVRASLMGMIFVLAKRLNRPYSAIHAISIVFILVTFLQPRVIYSIGFQLSFAITLSLVLFTQPLSQDLQNRFRIGLNIANALAVTIIAHLFSLPFLAYHFHVLSLSSLIVNILLMPLFALIIPWGYLCMIIASFSPPLGKWIALPLDGGLHIVHQLLDWVTALPFNLLSFAILPLWWYVFYIFVIVILLIPIEKYKRYKQLLLILSFLALIFPWVQQRLDSSVKITFLDVGQGDSIVIQGPGSFTMLIDGGGLNYFISQENWQIRRDPFDVGDDVVVPALRSLGVTKIDWLVLSHGDSDHIGGVKEIVKQMPIKYVLYNGKKPGTLLEEELMEMIHERNIPIHVAKVGPWLGRGKQITWEIVHPNSTNLDALNDNEASVVLLLSAYGRTVLFTGDLEAEGERKILSLLPTSIDILKVAHHGSKGSTTEAFLERIKPKYAIISVGKNNRYQHPHKEVLQRLQEYHTTIFRTDQQGALTYQITKQGEIRWKSWKSEKRK